ncbi:TIR domain-containing protein [bacterium]|nr:TIR domain-containing protein [bacterium]
MNDVFISYAHLDDRSLTEGEKGWISQFHRSLEVRLGQLLGEEPKVWRDPKLKGGDLFDETIADQFAAAKVMVSIVTPRYLKSEWCNKELREFCRLAENSGGLAVQDKSRVFKIIKTPVDYEHIPEEISALFKRVLGFEFYDIDPESGRVREYDETFGSEARQRFFEKVYDVAYEICNILRFSGNDSQTTQNEAADGGKKVYLAVSTSDQKTERDALRRELLERGCVILPSAPLPFGGTELKEAIAGYLKEADLAVHLVGTRYGMVPEECSVSLVELQNQLASQRSVDFGLDRLIWMPETLLSSDDRQTTFLEHLQSNKDVVAGAELVRDSLDNFRDYLIENLTEDTAESEARITSKANSEGSAPQLYLIYDQKDEDFIEPLEDALFNGGFDVATPVFEEDEAVCAQLHNQKLVHCDGVVIYYGSSQRSWVEMKLLDLRQAPGYGRIKPAPKTLIYVGPPEDRKKKRFKMHDVDVVVQDSGTFKYELIKGFIDGIKS